MVRASIDVTCTRTRRWTNASTLMDGRLTLKIRSVHLLDISSAMFE